MAGTLRTSDLGLYESPKATVTTLLFRVIAITEHGNNILLEY